MKSEVKSTLAHESESYDECVKAEVNEKIDTEKMKCIFSRSSGNSCQTVITRTLLNSLKIILNENKCNPPKTVLNTRAEFSTGFTRRYIKKDWYAKDVDFFVEKSRDMPKVTLRFSGMTKLKQVLTLIYTFKCTYIHIKDIIGGGGKV
jgi:hypothetical protein